MNRKNTPALCAIALAAVLPILCTTAALADPVPPPWQHSDVGDVGIPGDATNPFAKVGVMIRDSLDASAAHVLVDVTPSSLVEVLTRPSAGADTQWIGGQSPTAFPIWLKLTRTGSQFDAFASGDGTNWTHLKPH